MAGRGETRLNPRELEEMEKATNFTPKEIKRLYKRFKMLDTDKSGSISEQEFLSVPELAQNPLVLRVINIIDADKNKSVDFMEFISALSIFSSKGDKEAKLQFAFKVYDVNEDGYISNEELFTVLKIMVGSNLTDIQLQQIVDKTIIEADEDKDGRLSFEEFKKIIENTDLDTKMTFRF
mmetsp:Transcript_38214/g.61883  ORF Transcript_38214/g.61883 Transcript_38214/m.61883 type:complete len:179 (+) Transcript_38214:270-806(+)|eukprot:CAMPEP_0184661770 /NCGR_PEP_ID=MMETSP0308-20130426/40101_1 /TAXON_ID=38269 /ORGANISM="Gloeochaete witrockiana, Strain SAG 46.84" /LENGTH=178 /DNA_ID=CAMNT_0027103309 /DNA_START=237 /DNA_END=773 /DNA_ORIENTATION=-